MPGPEKGVPAFVGERNGLGRLVISIEFKDGQDYGGVISRLSILTELESPQYKLRALSPPDSQIWKNAEMLLRKGK